MPVHKSHYEASLAEYTNQDAAIALLKKYRPYLEMIPSLRRHKDSLIIIPLPIVRFRGGNSASTEAVSLPCDLAILMCDPEWKIKTGVEIFIYIHRPQEDFSDLLRRWRQTQVWLEKDYEWLMPSHYQHILSEGNNTLCPLFVVFPESSERIKRGLNGAVLPFVIDTPVSFLEEDRKEKECLRSKDE
ncbi:MAG: hypothetical protein AAF378_20475 [Cyanobacteria bacterium P01_A01_bin.84]